MQEISNFQSLNLPQPLNRALKDMGFEKPTPIQGQAIPVALNRRDVIGCAQTGTGKTAAFSIPLISRLLKAPNRTALILAPTRELAGQITAVLADLTRHLPEMSSTSLIGGMSMQPQMRALRKKPRIIVATPGRLVDHLHRGTVSLSGVEVLVLDEADRMLDMGFAPQLNEILRFLPKTRQTLLFSATFPKHIEQLAARFLKEPVRVTAGAVSRPAQKVRQAVIHTTIPKKNELLLDQLNSRQGSVLVFARTQVRTDRVARYLESYGLPVARIHGGRSQGQRNTAIHGFRDGKFRILVATDIAARGIDISHIAHVINFDLPQLPEDYVHRIGRTARASAEGEAVSFLTPEDKLQWREISKLLTQSGAAAPETIRHAPVAH